MNTKRGFNRRRFLESTLLATAALPFIATAAGSVAGAKGKPKVGCLSWCFHDLSPAADPEPAIDIIGEIGFDGIELIVTARKDIQEFWNDARIDRLKQKLDRHRLRVSQFVMFQPVVEGLSSTRREVRDQALDYFEGGCRIGRKFEAPMINIVAPWALELKGPSYYLPRYYDIENPKANQKFHMDIADGFDFERVWSGFVETIKACLMRAKAHGLKFSIENHTHTLVPGADAFLRLWDAIRDPDLGINLDAGWIQLEREYPPMAIHKLKGHIMNLHMRDIDGRMRLFPPFGDGVMDIPAIVETLKQIGFDGFASIEQDMHPGDRDIKETCRRYLKTMREYIG